MTDQVTSLKNSSNPSPSISSKLDATAEMTPNPKQNKQATSKPPEEPAAGGSTSNPEDNTSGEEFQEGEDEDIEVSLDGRVEGCSKLGNKRSNLTF